MAKEVVVTREGYNKLEQELENLRTVKRKEVADKIKVARGYGDLSENAEYDAAKEEQASVEARIAATLKLARIMDESELSNDTASIGMHVKILAEGDDLEDAEEYDLTGSTEADMDLNRISDESPVGAALIAYLITPKLSCASAAKALSVLLCCLHLSLSNLGFRALYVGTIRVCMRLSRILIR